VKKGLPLTPDKGVWSAVSAAAAAAIVLGKEVDEVPLPATTVATTTTARSLASESPLSKEKMEDPRNYRRSRLRSIWVCSAGTLAVTLLSAFALWSIVQSYRERQCDAKGCRMSHMSPIYLKAKDFDTEHTRFASKYNLYLYRENGVDEDYPVCYLSY